MDTSSRDSRRRHRAVIIVSCLVAFVLAATIASYALDPERKTLDAAGRAEATGRFVRLRDGITQYDVAGPDTARTVVLLTGFSVPYYLWDSTSNFLAGQGFRVLRYNYYGRGFSDRPALRYDLATYDAQLVELLDTLHITGKIDVAGVSMGGVVAASFADRHPDRTRSVILLDPAFADIRTTPLPLRVPGGELVVAPIMAPGMARSQLSDFVHPERWPDWPARYKRQMQYRGFMHSILATLRGDVFKRSPESFSTLAHSRIPMLLVWGRSDHTVPFARSDTVRAAFPRAEFHAIEDAGHLPQLEQAPVVDSILLRFLSATRRP